jgi:hypothetical protein
MKKALCFLCSLFVFSSSFAQCKIKSKQSMVDKTTTYYSQERFSSDHRFSAIISAKDTTYLLESSFILHVPDKDKMENIALKLLAKDEEVKQFTCKIDQNHPGLSISCPISKSDFPFLAKPMTYVKFGDIDGAEYSFEKRPLWGKWYTAIQNSVKCISTELKIAY